MQFGIYKLEIPIEQNTSRDIQIGEYESGITNRKIHIGKSNPENINWERQIGNVENTSRRNTNWGI